MGRSRIPLMCIRTAVISIFLAALIWLPAKAASQVASSIDIPYKKAVLKNGLTVILHEDHKAPIVAVNVWYHVGSKNEKPGKTGFAHLFEHLMFNGSENFDQDYFSVMEKIGATDLNGTTSEDRTNYFQNVPTSALDIALWMESDRMGHLQGAVTQAKLDEQRGVVQNEKRQYENQPYAVAEELIAQAAFPEGHPYSWTVIGSMEDLRAASLEDVHEWFKTYYGAANAVVAIAGDIDAESVLKKVEAYFGDVPPGPPIPKHLSYIAKRTGTHRQTVQDRVPQARISKIWNIPQWGTAEGIALSLAADVLSRGKNSRLYKRLVYTDQIATSASAYAELREIAGLFTVEAMARPGVELTAVEKAIDEELARFLADGPSSDELARVKAQSLADFVRGIERIGGFGGKSDILARSQVFGGSPDAYKKNLEILEKTTAAEVLSAAKKWLSDGIYILEIVPFPRLETTDSQIDRSKIPSAGAPPDVRFPALERATLSNGLKVILSRRDSVPVVNFAMVFEGGFAADQLAKPGTASLAMDVLDEGTKTRNSLQISEEAAKLGAVLGTGAGIDDVTVTLSALKANLDPSLALFADIILNPSFPEAEFRRLQKQTLAGIQQEKAEPIGIAIRLLPKLLYGADHPYGKPLSGSGTEESVSSMTREELAAFHRAWFKPNNATLIVVGATGMEDIKPRLEKLFGNWVRGAVPELEIRTVPSKTSPEVYLIDKPGAPSSLILAGELTLPKANPEEIAIESLNELLGGTFMSRLNMNLRESKHWSYGARTIVLDTRRQRIFGGYANVQTDKTADSVSEMRKEFSDIVGSRPPTEEELDRVKSGKVLGLPGLWETNSSVASSIHEMVSFGLPQDYFDTYASKVKGLNPVQVSAAARSLIKPEGIVYVIVGDRSKVDTGLKALGLGEVKLLDADGNPAGSAQQSK